MASLIRLGLVLGGEFLFGPWGALIGGFLGDLLFPPPGVKGPRLNELNVQHSTVGAPIPLIYGTVRLAGNVIWSGGLDEHSHTSGGGKKGGPEQTTYTYTVNVAIGIGEGGLGPIDGIRRIWADADLIFDSSDDITLGERLGLDNPDVDMGSGFFADIINAIRAMSAQVNFTFYPGSEDQLPDPVIESYKGVGNVPAFRGLAYVVFPNFDVTKYGNRIPNFRFETYAGSPTECGLYSPGHLEPWQFMLDSSVLDPRNPLNRHAYGYTEVGWPTTYTLDQALAQINAATDHPTVPFYISPVPQTDDGYVHGWSTSTTPNNIQPCDPAMVIKDYVGVEMTINAIPNFEHNCDYDIVGGTCGNLEAFFGDYNPRYVNAGQTSGVVVMTQDGGYPSDIFHGVPITSGDTFNPGIPGGTGSCSEPTAAWFRFQSHEMGVRRRIDPPDPCEFGTPLAGAPGYCVVNGQVTQGITWTLVSGTFHVLQKYAEGTSGFHPGEVIAYPVGPAVISTDPNYNDQDFWEAAYAEALAAGEPIAAGLVYGVNYPDTQSSAYFSECATVDTACVPMALIVASLCDRAGLRTDTATQIDVIDLTSCVHGYVVGSQMSARDALGPLRMYGLWDATESGEVLRFVERGHAIGATITSDDLGAGEAGQESPSAMQVARVQEKDLPRRVRVHFPNFKLDHEPSEQDASRITTEAVTELDVELPVVMDPDTAAQLAEIMLYAEWVGRTTFTFSLDNDWLKLEPTDCVEIPVDGETRRCRIVEVQYQIGGLVNVTATEDDDGAYQSTAVAIPNEPSGAVPGGPGAGPICPSVAVLLDIPRLRDIDVDAGYYAAIYGLCDSWTCAELYRSNDGGLTFQRVARTDAEATVGEIVDLTGPATDPTLPGDSPAYDDVNTITVTLANGELSSVTDAQIAAGQNMAAVGVDGRWVIVQFKTATLDTSTTWILSDLIWGLNDTEHLLGTTGAGDTFVLLSDPALLRIPESPEAIGVEKDFKVVTCGEALDDVDSFAFTTWGLSYQRLCPSTVLSATTLAPPVSPADGDSYLLPLDTSLEGVWATHGGEIATWSDETDSWVYCTPASGTIIHIVGDSSGGGDVISGGDGTTTDAPWTPAIPPLAEIDTSTDLATSYFVVWDGTKYVKVLGSEVGTGSSTGGGGYPPQLGHAKV